MESNENEGGLEADRRIRRALFQVEDTGKDDYEIARELGVPRSTVTYNRMVLGLDPAKKPRWTEKDEVLISSISYQLLNSALPMPKRGIRLPVYGGSWPF